MITYEIIEETFSTPELGSYTSYGILAYEDTDNQVVCSISDVFLDRNKASGYIQLFNEMELDVLHLPNILDDLLHYA